MSKGKEQIVKKYFDQTGTYLNDNLGIRIRQETITQFLGDADAKNVIDVACGNGMVSIPLLKDGMQLTLLDISDKMLEEAQQKIPVHFKHQVRLINQSITEIELGKENYDLVICMGLLAHLPKPLDVVVKISSILKPGGHLMIQNTNSRHPHSWMTITLYGWLKSLVGHRPYKLSMVSNRSVISILEQNGLKLENRFQYITSFAYFSRFFKGQRLYKFTNTFFGQADHKKNQWLGNDTIFHFVKK